MASVDYYEPNLLYEKAHTTPDEPSASTVLSRLEVWFSNSASATPQHIYLDLHRDDHSDASSHSNFVLDNFLSSEHECVKRVTVLLSDHLVNLFKRDPTSNLPSHRRFGFALTGDTLSDPLPPPSISHTAIISDPQVPKIHYSSLKFLEAREIRPNIRIAKSPAGPGSEAPQTKCIYKAVDFAREASSLSFEVTNYKRLVAKGPELEKWLVKIVGLVYIHDIEDEEIIDTLKLAATDSAVEDELEEANTQFIGALFTYHPQRDLSTHCYTTIIPEEIKICWFRQIVHAIAALESAGFEHWDLKCENIVLDTADGLPEEQYTNHILASDDITTARVTIERNRLERRSSTTTKPSPINPGKLKIIDLENSKSSAAFRPQSMAGQGHHGHHDPSKRRESVDQHPELGISMVYAMGKTILEIWAGKMPDVGDPTEKELNLLPETARKVVQLCCSNETRISAAEVKRFTDDLFVHLHDDDEIHE
ncbi:hypothetical protein TWF192_000125 [Orbilia oligospora]|uniref:Uncharacterized protein n=1 Tax=Orbilia oligospora TaxID=2813651 RepID=A0A6G1MQ56_ORBOL|nr:hypothetical protein TWF191_006807 [Orbilia oligospora]KAF3265476.1 hypothetical protein TWF192_000125 [Orbilia oligospora]